MVVSNAPSEISCEEIAEDGGSLPLIRSQDEAPTGIFSSLAMRTGCGRLEAGSSEKRKLDDLRIIPSNLRYNTYEELEERDPSDYVFKKVSFHEARTLSTASLSANTAYSPYENSYDSTQSENPSDDTLLHHLERCESSGEFHTGDVGETVLRNHDGEISWRFPRSEFLYNLSKEKQEEGKKRREAIALASMKRRQLPGPEDFGTIPLSRACDIYYRGMQALRAKKLRITTALNQKIDDELAQHEFKLAEGAFAYDLDTLRHNQNYSWCFIYPAMKKLPLARAHDMYERSLKVIHAKNRWLEMNLNASNCNQISEKIPLSRANDMYDKSIRILHARNRRLAQHEADKDNKDEIKLPISRAAAMYEKSIRYIHAKHEWLMEARKEKEEKEEQNKIVYGTLSVSRASHMHRKGVKHLQDKKERIAELRSVIEAEDDDESCVTTKISKISVAQGSDIYKRGLQKLYLKEAKVVQHHKTQDLRLSSPKSSRRTRNTDTSSATTMTGDTSTTLTGGSFDDSTSLEFHYVDEVEPKSPSRPPQSVTMTQEEKSFVSRANELYESSLNLIRTRYGDEQNIEVEVTEGSTLTYESRHHPTLP